MKRIIGFLLTAVMAFSLAACGSSAQDTQTNNTASQENTERTQNSGEVQSTENEGMQPDTDLETEAVTEVPADNGENDNPDMDTESADSNILVAYFSLAGDQYSVGVIEKGNTEIVAEMISEQIGADLFQMEPVIPYPTDSYDALLDFSRAEAKRPEIANTVENFEDYDVIFIGYPIWWGDMPNIVYTFLESYDFSGKTIVPFCTHGGSGLAGTESTIEDITGGTVAEGFAIAGTTAQNDRERAAEAVDEWLREAGYIE